MEIEKKFKEIFAVVAVILGLIALQWQLWVTNKLMVTHDSIIWYGVFHYFADLLHRGFLPFWNPYMNCGEPFFLNINILHLMDPSALLLILTGKFLRTDFLALYHYDLLLRYIIFICGAYLFFRYISKYKISALIAFITLSFSSLGTSYLRQHAFILAFYLLPWILLSIFKFLEQRNPKFLLCLALLLGIALRSYHSMFIIVSITILLTCLFLTKGLPKPKLKELFRNYKLSFGAFFIFLLLTISLLPIYSLYTYGIVPTVQIFEAPLGAFAFPADFFNLLTPYSFILHFFNWNYMSESFLYIGLIPLLLAIIGLWFSRHKYKWGFILTTVIVAFLMLGDNYFVYFLFHKFFPFFSIIRNMHTFGPFFIFCMVYFTCLGTDVIFESVYISKIRFYKGSVVFFFAALICLLALFVNSYTFNTFPSIAKKYHILKGYLSLTSAKELRSSLDYSFYKSELNILLFVVGSIIIFSLLKKSKININIKYFAVIFFVLADLLLFHRTVYRVVTMSRITKVTLHCNKPANNGFRWPVIESEYPFYAFVPAMLKIFTAYNPKTFDATTHFYEMKDFSKFVNDQQISDDVKNVLMAISVPKVRLVRNAVVLSHNKIIEELEKIDAKTAEKLIFIEEDLPGEYSHLERPLDNINNDSLKQGEIKVISFGPNEITMNVYSDEDSFLYYSDGFDKAWRVFIDGKEGQVYKTNLAFKSVIVDKGNHMVRFVYDPKFYKISLFCYFTGLSSLVVIFVCGIFRKKRNL